MARNRTLDALLSAPSTPADEARRACVCGRRTTHCCDEATRAYNRAYLSDRRAGSPLGPLSQTAIRAGQRHCACGRRTGRCCPEARRAARREQRAVERLMRSL